MTAQRKPVWPEWPLWLAVSSSSSALSRQLLPGSLWYPTQFHLGPLCCRFPLPGEPVIPHGQLYSDLCSRAFYPCTTSKVAPLPLFRLLSPLSFRSQSTTWNHSATCLFVSIRFYFSWLCFLHLERWLTLSGCPISACWLAEWLNINTCE